jgi:hypothetical protein
MKLSRPRRADESVPLLRATKGGMLAPVVLLEPRTPRTPLRRARGYRTRSCPPVPLKERPSIFFHPLLFVMDPLRVAVPLKFLHLLTDDVRQGAIERPAPVTSARRRRSIFDNGKPSSLPSSRQRVRGRRDERITNGKPPSVMLKSEGGDVAASLREEGDRCPSFSCFHAPGAFLPLPFVAR